MENLNWPKLFKSWVLIALGVLLAAWTSDGIHYDGWPTLVVAVLLISFFNIILRPLLILLALPLVVLTLGLGIFLINALMFLLVGALVPGFEVGSFWSALWGAFVVAFVSMIANLLFGKTRVEVRRSGRCGSSQPSAKRDDDVIDI